MAEVFRMASGGSDKNTKMENVRGKNTKRKHLNKNKKKSWRAVDINDVEEGLEDERLQERTGGKVAEKKNDDLFVLDTKKKDTKKVLEGKATRKRKAQERLKESEETLKPPPPKRKDKRAPVVIQKETKGITSSLKKTAIVQRKTSTVERRKKQFEERKLPVADFDLWGGHLEAETKKDDEHFLTVTRKRRVKVPEHLLKPASLLPAVEVPHAGASYNPDYDAHQALLMKAHLVEEEKIQKEQKLLKQLDSYFPKVKEAPTESSKLVEMAEGLFEDESEDNEENTGGTIEDDDLENLSVNPPVRRENKKDEKSRRKQREQKEKAKQLLLEKKKRMKDSSFFRLRSIKAEVKSREAELEVRAEKKDQYRAQEPYRTKRLGKVKYEEPNLDLKLSDELVGSLREMKPEGHLMEDRFKSFQKRNMLEPRGKAKKLKTGKHKMVEKREHRAITS